MDCDLCDTMSCQPPHCIETERAVLAAMLTTDYGAWTAFRELHDRDFHDTGHQAIFRAASDFLERGVTCTPTDVIRWLSDHSLAETAGGESYIQTLAQACDTTRCVESQIEFLKDLSGHRLLFELGAKLTEASQQPARHALEDVVAQVEQTLAAISSRHIPVRPEPLTIGELSSRSVDFIEARYEHPDCTPGLRTGLQQFDQLTGGLRLGELAVVTSACEGVTTALALRAIDECVLHQRIAVLVFSLVASGEGFALRLFASNAKLNLRRAYTGRMRDRDWPKFTSALGQFSDAATLLVFDDPVLSGATLERRTRAVFRRHAIGLIVVDGFHRLTEGLPVPPQHQAGLEQLARLKALATTLNVPVLALGPAASRLPAHGLLGPNADPGMLAADLVADIVVDPPRDKRGTTSRATLRVAYCRSGITGACRMRYRSTLARLDDDST